LNTNCEFNKRSNLSKIIHKTEFELDSDYTNDYEKICYPVSCPNSRLSGTGLLGIPRPSEYECKRPFIFIIHEKKYNVILFMGKFMKPKEWIPR